MEEQLESKLIEVKHLMEKLELVSCEARFSDGINYKTVEARLYKESEYEFYADIVECDSAEADEVQGDTGAFLAPATENGI